MSIDLERKNFSGEIHCTNIKFGKNGCCNVKEIDFNNSLGILVVWSDDSETIVSKIDAEKVIQRIGIVLGL